MKGKVKIGLNMLLMIIVLGVIFYVMDNSLRDIFAQLMETSWLVLIAVIFFGVVYPFAEGRSIKEIARYFNKDF
ncbi:lysylphosphatidylglycerol synthase transmembrane domain-containing protein, partial [Enterococcus faecalis]